MAKVVVGLSVLGLVVACSAENVGSSSARLSTGSGSSDDRDPAGGGPLKHHTGVGQPPGSGGSGSPGACFFTKIQGPFGGTVNGVTDRIVIDGDSNGDWEVWGDTGNPPALGPAYAWGCIFLSDFSNGGMDPSTTTIFQPYSAYAHQSAPEFDTDDNQATGDSHTWCTFGELNGKWNRAQYTVTGGVDVRETDRTSASKWDVLAQVAATDPTCFPFSGDGCEPKDGFDHNIPWCYQWTGNNIKYSGPNNQWQHVPVGSGYGNQNFTPVASTFCYIDEVSGLFDSTASVVVSPQLVGGVNTWVAVAAGPSNVMGYITCIPYNQQ
jgi:hypothetical protein